MTDNIFTSIYDPLCIILDNLATKTLLNCRLINKFFANYLCNANLISKRVIKIKNRNIRYLLTLKINWLFYNVHLDDMTGIYDIKELKNVHLLHIPQHARPTENNYLASSFPHLRYLIIDDYKISNDTIKQLTNLETLNLICNKTITHEGIYSLNKLKELHLEHNTHVTDLKMLTNLKWLNLRRNYAVTDDGIKMLTNLTNLDLLNNNNVTDDGISKLINLKTLNLSTNENITNYGIRNLTNITNLSLFDNNCVSNDGIQQMIQLETLDLGYNSLISNISHLTNLRKLDLCANDTIMPMQLDALDLEVLSLRDNTVFNDEHIAKLTSVKSLNLCYNSNNKITNNGLREMTQLTHLNLWGSRNKITHNGINYLTNLKSLVCSSQLKTRKITIADCKFK